MHRVTSFTLQIFLAVFLLGSLGILFTPTFVEAHSSEPFIILLTKNGFEPSSLELVQGDTVIFKNEDTDFRWPASNIHPTHTLYPEFDPKTAISPGEEWQFTFTKTGEWRMHDHLIPEFTGDISVTADPNYVAPTTTAKANNNNFFVSLWNTIRYTFAKLYYKLFPAQLERTLERTSIMHIAKDESSLMYWLKLVGPRKVMGRLVAETNGGSVVDCHSEAHQVGHAAYVLLGASVYTEGDASCHSGFYHGVMEAFISEKGTSNLSGDIEQLCDSLTSDFDIFECYHGVGHGMMAYFDYDVPVALENCGKLSLDYNKSSCYGGVFMENVIAGQGNAAVKSHGTKWLSQEDPLFPCNDVGDDYQVLWSCYVMQTSWMLEIYDYDFQKVADACLLSRPDMINTCYTSYGRDSAGYNLRDPQKILASCALVPKDDPEYYRQCIVGALYVILDFWGPKLADQGEEFCRVVPEHLQSECYDLVSLRKTDVHQ